MQVERVGDLDRRLNAKRFYLLFRFNIT